MNFEVEEVSPVLRRISFDVPAKQINQLLNDAYRTLGKQVRLKGFRPGKVPRKVLEQMPRFRGAAHEDILRKLHDQSVQALFEESELHILALAKSEPGKIAKGKNFNLILEVEILPEIELEGLEEIEVPFEKVEISDDNVQAMLEQEREKMSTLESVEDREAEEGDRLQVDYSIQTDEADPQEISNFVMWLGREQLPTEVEEALTGKKVGDVVEVTVEEEADEEEGTEASTSHYKVTITEIQAKVLPENDDEMAKDADYDDLESMKNALRENLENAESTRSEHRGHEKMLDALIEKFDPTIPPTYLENHIDQKAEGMVRQLRQMTNNQIDFDPANFRENMREEATREVQIAILIQQVHRTEEFEIADEEVDAELEKIATSQGRSVAYLKSLYGERELDALRGELKQRKAIDFLWSKVKHNEETLTKEDRDKRIEDERAAEMAAAEEQHSHDHEHTHDHNCDHDHDHSHDHGHDH